jgi:hypothetical protein
MPVSLDDAVLRPRVEFIVSSRITDYSQDRGSSDLTALHEFPCETLDRPAKVVFCLTPPQASADVIKVEHVCLPSVELDLK